MSGIKDIDFWKAHQAAIAIVGDMHTCHHTQHVDKDIAVSRSKTARASLAKLLDAMGYQPPVIKAERSERAPAPVPDKRPFTDHDGKKCPYDSKVRVDVLFRDGSVWEDFTADFFMDKENWWKWARKPSSAADIIAHRPSQDGAA